MLQNVINRSFVKISTNIGHIVLAGISQVRQFFDFLTNTVRMVFRKPFRRRLIFQQMEFIGNESLLIVMISGFFMGAVFSLQIGSIFAIFGAQGMMGAASGKALSRELSPLVTGFLLFSGTQVNCVL